MRKTKLTLFKKIKGIGSASGLVYTDEKLFIISDNSTFLYEYNLKDKSLNQIPLVENSTANIIKKDKPDFETVTKNGDKLLLFGSGSTVKRNTSVSYCLKKNQIKEQNLNELYQNVRQKLKITNDELNIEGIIIHNNELLLFQRGNGINAKNGIIKVGNEIIFFPIFLPKIQNIEATFTDAVLAEDKIYFLAAAEDTKSTFDDGEILGTLVGCLDLTTLKVDFTQQISDTQKFEGVTLYKKTAKHIELLLCEDNDNNELISTIYKLKLPTEA